MSELEELREELKRQEALLAQTQQERDQWMARFADFRPTLQRRYRTALQLIELCQAAVPETSELLHLQLTAFLDQAAGPELEPPGVEPADAGKVVRLVPPD